MNTPTVNSVLRRFSAIVEKSTYKYFDEVAVLRGWVRDEIATIRKQMRRKINRKYPVDTASRL